MAEFFKPRDVVHRPRKGKRERLAVGAGASGLTPGVYTIPAVGGANESGAGDATYVAPKQPTSAIIQVLTNAINFTIDGTVATNALGFVAQPNDIIFLNTTQEIVAFSAIQNAASAGAIEVQYLYGY